MSQATTALRDPDFDSVRARILLALAVVGFGILAVRFGQTASWDLRNYHLYNAWAWLGGRADLDIAPAQLQSFFNPLLHAGMYLGTRWLHPVAFEFVLGCVQGLNAVLLYSIARRLLPPAIQRGQPWFALAIALVGATGATQFGELGGTAGDNLVSLAVLGGILLVLSGTRTTAGSWVPAGLVLGAGVGLKLAFAPLALGLGLSAVALAPGGMPRWRIGVVFGLAGIVGVLATGGFWMATMWERFGNPVYPLFSSVFGGEWAPPHDTRDVRFIPPDALRALLYPLAWTADWRLSSELRFRDLRLPALFLAAVILPWWRAAPVGGNEGARADADWLLLALAIGYAIWLPLFGYYRYLAPWEMLAPLAFVLLLARAKPGWSRLRLAAGVAMVLMFVATNAPEWGVAKRYGSRFLDVTLPASPRAGGAMVLMAGDAPLAYLALGFPADARFVRVQSNLHGGAKPPFRLDLAVAEAIDTGVEPLLAMFTQGDASLAPEPWSRFGVRVRSDRCGRVESNLMRGHEAQVLLCEVERVRPAREALGDEFARWRAACAASPPTEPQGVRTCRAIGATTGR